MQRNGLDIPNLEILILASPHKDKATIVQAIGRIERKFEGKETPICYDIVDNDIYFEKAWKVRKGIYKKNNNKIID